MLRELNNEELMEVNGGEPFSLATAAAVAALGWAIGSSIGDNYYHNIYKCGGEDSSSTDCGSRDYSNVGRAL